MSVLLPGGHYMMENLGKMELSREYRSFHFLPILPVNFLSTKNHVEETKKHQGEQCLEQIEKLDGLGLVLVYV